MELTSKDIEYIAQGRVYQHWTRFLIKYLGITILIITFGVLIHTWVNQLLGTIISWSSVIWYIFFGYKVFGFQKRAKQLTKELLNEWNKEQ